MNKEGKKFSNNNHFLKLFQYNNHDNDTVFNAKELDAWMDYIEENNITAIGEDFIEKNGNQDERNWGHHSGFSLATLLNVFKKIIRSGGRDNYITQELQRLSKLHEILSEQCQYARNGLLVGYLNQSITNKSEIAKLISGSSFFSYKDGVDREKFINSIRVFNAEQMKGNSAVASDIPPGKYFVFGLKVLNRKEHHQNLDESKSEEKVDQKTFSKDQLTAEFKDSLKAMLDETHLSYRASIRIEDSQRSAYTEHLAVFDDLRKDFEKAGFTFCIEDNEQYGIDISININMELTSQSPALFGFTPTPSLTREQKELQSLHIQVVESLKEREKKCKAKAESYFKEQLENASNDKEGDFIFYYPVTAPRPGALDHLVSSINGLSLLSKESSLERYETKHSSKIDAKVPFGNYYIIPITTKSPKIQPQ